MLLMCFLGFFTTILMILEAVSANLIFPIPYAIISTLKFVITNYFLFLFNDTLSFLIKKRREEGVNPLSSSHLLWTNVVIGFVYSKSLMIFILNFLFCLHSLRTSVNFLYLLAMSRYVLYSIVDIFIALSTAYFFYQQGVFIES